MALRVGGTRWLSAVLLFALLAASAASLSWDLREPRSRAGKIRVHPRGNLWATGHFMGKKSLEPPSSSLLKTALHVSLGDQRLQLSHDLLRILLLKKALGMRPGDPVPHTQNHVLLGTSDERTGYSEGRRYYLSAIGLEGLKHADRLENLRGSST